MRVQGCGLAARLLRLVLRRLHLRDQEEKRVRLGRRPRQAVQPADDPTEDGDAWLVRVQLARDAHLSATAAATA
eukprot:4307253-Prymnesium_polylepis.1